jgi:hypothetical protein
MIEDTSILWEDDRDIFFPNLMKKSYPADMIERSAKMRLGDGWKKEGARILKKHGDKALIEKFEKMF